MSIFGLEINLVVFWLAISIFFIVVEAITIGLLTIWFAIGALGSLILALIGAPFWLQLVMFFILSLCLLAFTRKFFVDKLKLGSKKTNLEAMIGEKAVVISAIEPYKVGRVRVGGQEWAALAEVSSEAVDKDQLVKITAIEGVKLIVKPVYE